MPERVEDSAGRGYLLTFENNRSYPRLHSIAMQPAEPECDTELLVAYEYDASGNLARVSKRQGTGIFYDNRFDRPAIITDALGATTALRYDESGNLASVTNALGQRASYHYNENGLPVKVTDAVGAVKTARFKNGLKHCTLVQ